MPVRKKSSARRATVPKPRTRVKASVNLVTQGKNRFYTLSLYSTVLGRTCFVTRRSDDPKHGFQRVLEVSRAKNIAKYIENGGSIPTSIVLSAQPQAELKIVGGGKTLEFNDVKDAFLVLDGQHRVYGFSLTDFNLRVPVVIYNNLTRQQEVRLFIDINTNQKPVPNALLLDIRRLAGYQSDQEAFLSELFDQFNSNGDSPLVGLLSSSEQSPGKISRPTFNLALKPAMNLIEDLDVEEAYRVFQAYIKVWYDGLKSKKVIEALTKSVVFRAVIGLFPLVSQRVFDRHGPEYNVETFAEILTLEYFASIRSKMKGNVGNSVKAFQDKLAKPLSRSVSLGL